MSPSEQAVWERLRAESQDPHQTNGLYRYTCLTCGASELFFAKIRMHADETGHAFVQRLRSEP